MVDLYKDFEFPAELCLQPTCLIGFMGLNVQSNSVHKNIWDAFSCNRPSDRLPLKYLNLAFGYNFPVSKPKRTSYEWYIPKGILKCNWINKHLNLIPALIVLFYELDWDDQHLTEKVSECSTYVRNIKTSFEERNTKIAVVLIQKNDLLLTGNVEDSLITERSAGALCAACEIDSNSLLLLHLNDHLQGYVIRLETAFHELAESYYQQEIRTIKSHADYLSKTAHQYLFVRHQFKIGFFHELKRDLSNARKHYSQAYSILMELRVMDSNTYEIKVTAAFLIYKLCKLHFALDFPREAISLFSAHIQRNKLKTGPPELYFEHLTWLSKQFSMFGDLFEEATRRGLPALQSKHPGFYYEEAAEHAMQRKKYVQESLQNIDSYPDPDPLIGWDKLEFYGQRPWRVNKLFSDVADNVKEQLGFAALQYRDKFIVNHSTLIITYLGIAISQFKMYRSPRKRKYLVVQMAEEYYTAKDYGKALTLFSHLLWEYRSDQWWPIVAHLTKSGLKCAYLTTSLSTYVELSIEGACVFEDIDDKLRAMDNVLHIVKGTAPIPEPDLLESDVIAASIAWSSMVISQFKPLTVDMNAITSFIYCKARFTEANNDLISVQIFFRNVFPKSLKFSKLSLIVSTLSGNSEFTICKDNTDEQNSNALQLLLEPNLVKQFDYSFAPLLADIGAEIKIVGISLMLGSYGKNGHLVSLQFSGSCKQRGIDQLNVSNLREHNNFEKIKPILSVQLKPKVSQMNLTVHHKPPNLVAEWYPVTIIVENKEQFTAIGCTLQINFVSSEIHHVNTTDVLEVINGSPNCLPFDIDLGNMEPGIVRSKVIYIKTRSTDTRNFAFKVTYNICKSAEEQITCTKEETFALNCVGVFDVTASFLSMKCQYIEKLYTKEPVFMTMQIDCTSAWPVVIENTKFSLNNEISWNPENYSSQLKQQRLEKLNVGCEMMSFTVEKPTAENALSLGIFSIFWKRDDDEDSFTTCTDIQLPEIHVDALPVYVEANVPTPGFVKKPLAMTITIWNYSEELVPFNVSIEHDDAFMFSGNKQDRFNVLPESSHSIHYNLFPLHAGLVTLPRINLTVNSDIISQDILHSLLKRTLPSVLFILPQQKGETPVENDVFPFLEVLTGNAATSH